MKATIELEDNLYRRLKAEAALRGTTVKELVAEGVRHILGESSAAPKPSDTESSNPPWFGALRKYAPNARGKHDMASIRRSIVRGRTRSKP